MSAEGWNEEAKTAKYLPLLTAFRRGGLWPPRRGQKARLHVIVQSMKPIIRRESKRRAHSIA